MYGVSRKRSSWLGAWLGTPAHHFLLERQQCSNRDGGVTIATCILLGLICVALAIKGAAPPEAVPTNDHNDTIEVLRQCPVIDIPITSAWDVTDTAEQLQRLRRQLWSQEWRAADWESVVFTLEKAQEQVGYDRFQRALDQLLLDPKPSPLSAVDGYLSRRRRLPCGFRRVSGQLYPNTATAAQQQHRIQRSRSNSGGNTTYPTPLRATSCPLSQTVS